jgi:hypothetical protein
MGRERAKTKEGTSILKAKAETLIGINYHCRYGYIYRERRGKVYQKKEIGEQKQKHQCLNGRIFWFAPL